MLLDYVSTDKIEKQIKEIVEDTIVDIATSIDIRDYINHETVVEKVSDALEYELSDCIDDYIDDAIEKM